MRGIFFKKNCVIASSLCRCVLHESAYDYTTSLMFFGWRICDLCKSCFLEGNCQSLGGVLRVWVVDSICVFSWNTSLYFSLFVTSIRWLCACWNSTKYKFFLVFLKLWTILWFQLDQFFHQISLVLITLSNWIRCSCNRGRSALSNVGPHHFPRFQKADILLLLYLQYFLLPFINVARSWVIRMVRSTVWTFHFVWALFLHVVRVFFAALFTCPSSSASFPMVSIFLSYEMSQGC